MNELIITSIAILAIALLLKYYNRFTRGCYKVNKDLTGKTVLITGGSTGIGKETALALAAKGARVIITCRDVLKGEKTKQEIIERTNNPQVYVKQLDLCSFQSVRHFVDEFLKTENRLDVLINNAGMMPSLVYEQTHDGFDETIQANHLGHFLLTLLLLDLLKQTAPSRVVILAAVAAWIAKVDPKNLDFKPSFFTFLHYAKTKTLNILFGVELAKLLLGTGVTVNSCHPGVIVTELSRSQRNAFYYNFAAFLIKQFGKTPEEGAMTTLYLATSDEVSQVSGKYFSDCKPATAPPWATNPTNAKYLWETSLKAVGLTQVNKTDANGQVKTIFSLKKNN